MAEFQEVMKQRERMCDLCEVKGEACVNCLGHLQNIRKNPQESEMFILKWAFEHPIKTNADKFKEVFGFMPDSEYCPNKCPENVCANCEYRHFGSQEYKEPKGE